MVPQNSPPEKPKTRLGDQVTLVVGVLNVVKLIVDLIKSALL